MLSVSEVVAQDSGGNTFNETMLLLLAWLLVAAVFLIAGRKNGGRPSMKVVGLASIFSLMGGFFGMLWGFSVEGTFLGSNLIATRWSAAAAGVGWVAGAVLGASRTQGAPLPTPGEAGALRLCAVLFMVTALVFARWIIVPSFFETDGGFYIDSSRLVSIQLICLLDGAVAAGTCLVLARPRRRALPAGEPMGRASTVG